MPWRPPAPEPVVRLTTLERLRDGQAQLSDRLTGWIVAIALGVLAFVIRVVDLGRPATIMFDETYYAKDAWALLKFGYEVNWPSTANASIASGTVNVYDSTAEFVVHPQLGKWLIASGEAVFGMNAFGWRIAACVFGSLLIVATVRLARRVSRSTLIGGIAGVLLCADGLEFTMSRIALLDIFQAFFLVAAVGAVVADRDYFRWKLADKMTALAVSYTHL
ncbi:MAG TPA: dolichyl-phosphate-mannose--protein mannosyltransferase, partial [Propionibacteriaceae bacterium]|nr:dolichyl-phosphate-mannose--protein mannosyltransferase [Propionibacteriaceae bacterium]